MIFFLDFEHYVPGPCVCGSGMVPDHVWIGWSEDVSGLREGEWKRVEKVVFICVDCAANLMSGYPETVVHLNGGYCPEPFEECSRKSGLVWLG